MNTLHQLFIAMLLLVPSTHATSKNLTSEPNQIQRVRIDFHTPLGFTRHLLLAFTPDNAATDGIDYGYDAVNFDSFPDDMNWMIDGQGYVIQGVGEFNVSKCYPLGLFLSNTGNIGISLNQLENFESDIEVYVFDALLETFSSIKTQRYNENLNYGDYLQRFYITFTDDIDQINFPVNTLSIGEHDKDNTVIKYLSSTKELLVETKTGPHIKNVIFYTITGQQLQKFDFDTERVRIPIDFMRSNSIIVKVTDGNGYEYAKNMVFY